MRSRRRSGSGRAGRRRGRRRRGPRRPAAWTGPGTMSPACWRTSDRKRHDVGVAGVEADPDAGQVGPLRERVDGHHAVDPVVEDRRGRPPGPGELGVALVGEHGHAPRPSPGGGGAEVGERAGGVGRAVHPERQGPRRRPRPTRSTRSRPPPGRFGDARPPGSRPAGRSGRRWDRRRPGPGRCRVRASAAGGTTPSRPRTPWSPRRRPSGEGRR